MNTLELKVPGSAAAPGQSLDQEVWLDTALEGTFPASDPISTFHADDAIFIREARPMTITGISTTTPVADPTALRRAPVINGTFGGERFIPAPEVIESE